MKRFMLQRHRRDYNSLYGIYSAFSIYPVKFLNEETVAFATSPFITEHIVLYYNAGWCKGNIQVS